MSLPTAPDQAPAQVPDANQDRDIAIVVAILEKIGDRDTPNIHSESGSISINDIIAEIKAKTPKGIELIEQHRELIARQAEKVIQMLRETPNLRMAMGTSGIFTAAQLITEIEMRTEVGLRILEMYKNEIKRREKQPEKQKEPTGVLGSMRSRIQRIAKRAAGMLSRT